MAIVFEGALNTNNHNLYTQLSSIRKKPKDDLEIKLGLTRTFCLQGQRSEPLSRQHRGPRREYFLPVHWSCTLLQVTLRVNTEAMIQERNKIYVHRKEIRKTTNITKVPSILRENGPRSVLKWSKRCPPPSCLPPSPQYVTLWVLRLAVRWCTFMRLTL